MTAAVRALIDAEKDMTLGKLKFASPEIHLKRLNFMKTENICAAHQELRQKYHHIQVILPLGSCSTEAK
ncbi:hypothetical protein V5F77_00785 [Xanthobacter sp. DSM 24535]|uniref:hypothetical protein n=1 Tax=Roseixanthobacter psychrophilus TaxID=3119917 RepID=UPI0037294FB8